MEKLRMHSPDFTEENIRKLAELFPDCVTESRDDKGRVKHAVDFDLLRQELSSRLVEGPQERYRLDWPGKREALLTANAPIAKTLRPCREESVDFDTTENLFIEGDNLDALKLLQETYLGKVKMIYIDPPYNTGKDFIYRDRFAKSVDDYLLDSGQEDEEGNRLVANLESNGRFHSDWLSMMYPRLKLARNLLRDDGVIFVSIDDNEVANLRKLCDEIFGEENFINLITVKLSESTGVKMSHVDKRLPKLKEYILLYKRSDIQITPVSIPKEKWDNEYKHVLYGVTKEELSKLKEILFSTSSTQQDIIIADEICQKISLHHLSTLFEECNATTEEEKLNVKYENAWRIVRDVATTGNAKKLADEKKKIVDANFFVIVTPTNKKYLIKSDYNEDTQQPRIKLLFADSYLTVNPGDFWQDIKTTGLDNEGEVDFKNGKKPLKMLDRLLKLCTAKDKTDIILDFFAGSCTTVHAVMKLNAEDGGKRKYIMIQLPEPCDEKSEAYKAGYKTIAEIGKERIRRAAKKIKEEHPDWNGDTGFRVLKVDSSNLKDIYYSPDAVQQTQLELFTDNIKDDRTPEDLLFQVLLDWGVDLSLPITKEIIADREVFFVDENALAACFEKTGTGKPGITEDFVKELAKREPLRVVFRDQGFRDDSVKINVEQIFKALSPHTEVKTI